MRVELDAIMSINGRTRYNVWDLLGDVGGFNDGLVLLGQIIMGSYSAFAYKSDIFGTQLV